MKTEILEVRNLQVYYRTAGAPVKAVDDVTFSLKSKEKMGVVGESGSGKSTLAFALMGLTKPPGYIEGGQVLLNGLDLTKLSEDEMRKVRLAQIALVPQGAMNSLNPVMHIKDQIIDGIIDHLNETPISALEERVSELLKGVELKPEVADFFPHELSGGMKQRVCLAIAISLSPKVIIADELTSALDVVMQRQIMLTLGQVQESIGASVLLVGHDMGLMAQFVERMAVLYAGKLAEVGSVREIFKEPLHPYTQLLISCLPSLEGKRRFKGIPGLPPLLLNLPSGCAFHPRCPQVMSRCSLEVPSLNEVCPGRWVACHLYTEVKQ
ncbi:Oligopeptide transport ATP-binding protein OppD [subsurface metagenome]